MRVLLYIILMSAAFVLFVYEKLQTIKAVYAKIRADVLLMILREPEVLDAEILYDNSVGYPMKLAVRILFRDGGAIEVHNVDEHNKRSIYIYSVDDYAVHIADVNLHGAYDQARMPLWSAITGAELSDIISVIKNHNIIREQVKSWPNVDDYLTEEEKPEQRVGAAIARINNGNMFPGSRFIFEGREYSLLKYESPRRRRNL